MSKLCIIYNHSIEQVIEEARRVLMIGEGECQDFMRDCVQRLTEEIEFLVYHGINSKGSNPPRSPKLSKSSYFLNINVFHIMKCCHLFIYTYVAYTPT